MKKFKTFTIFSIFVFIIYLSFTLYNNNVKDIMVGFSPGEYANKIVLTAIKESKLSINIAAYSFTSKEIALALINSKKKGIDIHIVADKKSNNIKYSVITYLVNNGISIKLNDKYAIMHNKFMIIDRNSVETGSFNYTKNAVYHNAENVIYLRNRSDIAKKYMKEFNRLWNQGVLLQPKY